VSGCSGCGRGAIRLTRARRHWTAAEVCESEEAWFLRKGGQRARCRLIKMLADEFGLSVNHIQDIQVGRAQKC